MNRRGARMAELTKEALEAFDGRTFSFQTVATLARVFGTHLNRKRVWHYGAASEAWEDYDAFLNLGPEEAVAEIWTYQLEPVLASRLQYCGPSDAGRLRLEIVASLKLIGASYASSIARWPGSSRSPRLGPSFRATRPRTSIGSRRLRP